MSTPTKTQFLFLFRDSSDNPDLSSEQLQEAMGKWMEWLRGLKQQGIYIGGNRLEEGRKVLRNTKFTDGPYVESKELVGGFIVVLADSLAQAEHLAKGCPGLAYGTDVEIRPMMPSVL
jgi:hypothetical protein